MLVYNIEFFFFYYSCHSFIGSFSSCYCGVYVRVYRLHAIHSIWNRYQVYRLPFPHFCCGRYFILLSHMKTLPSLATLISLLLNYGCWSIHYWYVFTASHDLKLCIQFHFLIRINKQKQFHLQIMNLYKMNYSNYPFLPIFYLKRIYLKFKCISDFEINTSIYNRVMNKLCVMKLNTSMYIL